MAPLTVLFIVYGGAIGGLLVGGVYFARASPGATLSRRLMGSLYGPAIALLLVAVMLWPDQYRWNPQVVTAFYWLQVVPLSLLIYSLARYPGRPILHLVLVPIALLCWALVFAIGFLKIHGE